MSPTSRTLKRLRDLGFLATVAEQWVIGNPERCKECGRHKVQIRRDLFGVIDIVALHPRDRLVLFVQTTDSTSVSKRVTKLREHPNTRILLRAGVAVEVWGWPKAAPYKPRIERLTEGMLDTKPLPVKRGKKRPKQKTLFGEEE